MSDLKPCPFCGGENLNKINLKEGSDFTLVTCLDCGGGNAIAAWNTRSADPKLDTAMKLLRDNQSPMHFDREMSQADHDILREARKWR